MANLQHKTSHQRDRNALFEGGSDRPGPQPLPVDNGGGGTIMDMIEESNASLQRTKRMVAETEVVAHETSQTLHRQGEQLQKASGDLDQIEDNMNTADRLVRGMESIGGSIVNWFTRGKRKNSAPRRPSNPPDYQGTGGPSRGQVATPPRVGSGGNVEYQEAEQTSKVYGNSNLEAHIKEQDKQLNEIGSMLSVLKRQGEAMGHEIDRQNRVIETIDNKSDNVSGRIQTADRRIRNIR